MLPTYRGFKAGALAFALMLAGQSALAAPPKAPKREAFPRELDAYIAAALREWDLPGAAVAVVKDGQLVVAKGYGVRELGRPEKVDENTIFDMASLTKSFTAAAISSLVDEHKLSWDVPVRTYLPTLEFSDPYLTDHVTLRDLLCHRTDIRPTNSAWYLTNVTRPRLLGLVANMQVAAPFRTKFVYWNIGYTIAGEAAATVARTSWEDLITQRLILPLGLSRTTAHFDSVPAMGNFASGHELISGAQRVTPRETTRASTAPAGAIQASVADLATWMLFQLGDGTFQGRRILSADAMYEMHSAQLVGPANEKFRTARQLRFFPAYGLGWQVFDYRGHPLLWHSGNGDGQLAYMALLPELHLGVAVLINSWKVGSALNGGIASRIMDHYLAFPARDYSAELRDGWTKSEQAQTDGERALVASRLPRTEPSLPNAAYAGVFKDRLGLDVRVWLEGDTLRLQYGGGEHATLDHWHHDTYRARWRNPLHAKILPTFVSFGLNERGKIDRLHMEPFGDEIDARRVEQ
jgi:CubicO group peptidase (beta-lactamase class C family)